MAEVDNEPLVSLEVDNEPLTSLDYEAGEVQQAKSTQSADSYRAAPQRLAACLSTRHLLMVPATVLGLLLVKYCGYVAKVHRAVDTGAITGLASKPKKCANDYSDDCTSMPCCSKFMTCYEKNDGWAACKPSCALGVPEDVPPWDPSPDVLPWSCKVHGARQAPPRWMPSNASPSLFCFAVTLVQGGEPELLSHQLATGTGVFGCNAYSMFSERKMLLGQGPTGVVATSPIGGPMSSSAKNVQEFLRAWRVLHEEGGYKDHDWTVKLDPDALFLASRLQQKLRTYGLSPKDDPLYFRNCGKFASVQGPLEVASLAATERFLNGLDKCSLQDYMMAKGEDWFFGHCMEYFGVRPAEDYALLDDEYCSGLPPDCTAGLVAFHPFKTVEMYLKCLEAGSESGVEK